MGASSFLGGSAPHPQSHPTTTAPKVLPQRTRAFNADRDGSIPRFFDGASRERAKARSLCREERRDRERVLRRQPALRARGPSKSSTGEGVRRSIEGPQRRKRSPWLGRSSIGARGLRARAQGESVVVASAGSEACIAGSPSPGNCSRLIRPPRGQWRHEHRRRPARAWRERRAPARTSRGTHRRGRCRRP